MPSAQPAVATAASTMKAAPVITLATLLGAATMLLVSGIEMLTDGQCFGALTMGPLSGG